MGMSTLLHGFLLSGSFIIQSATWPAQWMGEWLPNQLACEQNHVASYQLFLHYHQIFTRYYLRDNSMDVDITPWSWRWMDHWTGGKMKENHHPRVLQEDTQSDIQEGWGVRMVRTVIVQNCWVFVSSKMSCNAYMKGTYNQDRVVKPF